MFNRNNSKESESGKSNRGRRRVITFCAALGVFGASLGAFAAYTSNGEFNASGSTAVAKRLQVTGSVDGAIWPGDCNDVVLTANNPNPHSVTVTGLNNTGFRDVSDTAASEGNNANRLEDFLYQADVSHALDGKVIPANDSKTFTVKDAVCLRGSADDARQGQTFKAGYFLAVQVNPGNEADSNS